MRDTSICRYCGYQIREISADANCPECGQPAIFSKRPNSLSRTAEYASSALIVGIFGLLLSPIIGIVMGPIAIVLASLALRRMPSTSRSRAWKQAAWGMALGVLACIGQFWPLVLGLWF